LVGITSFSLWRSELRIQCRQSPRTKHGHQRRYDDRDAMPLLAVFLVPAEEPDIEIWETTDLTVDVRDAVGDRLHVSDEFTKDGVRYRDSLLSANELMITDHHPLFDRPSSTSETPVEYSLFCFFPFNLQELRSSVRAGIYQMRSRTRRPRECCATRGGDFARLRRRDISS
jgi:hypothetical protein